jgi:hypothetical protein
MAVTAVRTYWCKPPGHSSSLILGVALSFIADQHETTY